MNTDFHKMQKPVFTTKNTKDLKGYSEIEKVLVLKKICHK